MQKTIRYYFFVLFIAIPALSFAQSFSIKPYVGYATVQMKEVNSGIQSRVESLIGLTGVTVPQPDPFKGNIAWGVQFGYHLEDNYFLTFGTYFYSEDRTLHYRDESLGYQVIFDNMRNIKLFEASFGMKYLFSYSSWKRFNFYVGGGIGFAIGWSETFFWYSDETNFVNNKGDFSSIALSGHILGGISIRLSPSISVEPEIGYRAANLAQMEGELRFSQNFPNFPGGQEEGVDNQFITEENYNFSGFFVNIGLQYAFSF